MSILDAIRSHEQIALSPTPPPDLVICPKCQEQPLTFRPYDCRTRIFLIICGGIVQKVDSFLSRWKCPLCVKKFPYYPSFAIPFKRYVRDSFESLARQYLTDDKATYREVVKYDKTPIVYSDEKNPKEERRLEPSTVWRWLGYLGSREKTFGKAFKPIDQSPLPFNIPCWKYRSNERMKLLGRAINLLHSGRCTFGVARQIHFPQVGN